MSSCSQTWGPVVDHYTLIWANDGLVGLTVVTAAEARDRLTVRPHTGETAYGKPGTFTVLTEWPPLVVNLNALVSTLIIIPGTPVADQDPWRFGRATPDPDPAPNPSPGIARLAELDARNPYTGNDD